MYCLEKLNPSSARSARPTWEGSTWPRSRLRGLQPLQVAMLCLLAWTSTLSDITNTSGDFHLSVNKMFLVIVGASWNHSRMVLRWASAPTPTAWRIGGWLLGTTGSLTASTCRQPGITFWLALWRGMLCKSEWPSSYINPLHRCSRWDLRLHGEEGEGGDDPGADKALSCRAGFYQSSDYFQENLNQVSDITWQNCCN